MRNVQAWLCRNGHVLGMIKSSGNRRSLLELYRHAVDLNAESPAEIDVMGLLVGGMKDIRCDICNDVRIWHRSGLGRSMDGRQILDGHE